MTELEHALSALAAEVEWPETPQLELRLDVAAQARPRRRRLLVVAIALALVAVGIAFAVPQARSAILRFFHIGGATIELVSTLPAAEERSLAAGLGEPVSAREASDVLGRPVRLPDTHGSPQLYARDGAILVLLATPEPVLLTELGSGSGGVMKKVAGGSTGVEWVQIVPGNEGIWIAGAPHVFFFPEAPPRLAGNVLLWEDGETTFRLEGRTLTMELALRLAREILR
jgi:hypothetical protein